MNAVKADDTQRVRLPMLAPGDNYVPELLGGNAILLHKIPTPPCQISKAEVLATLVESPMRFKGSWEDLKADLQ